VSSPIPRPRVIAAVTAAAALALPAAASAHVTVQPSTAPAGGFTRLDVRVPNERDDSATTKVDVQMPPGFAEASYEPRPGWTVTVQHKKLATPIKTDEGDEITEAVSRITWTGRGKQGRIAPGQFADFGLSVAMPDGKAGDKLIFKALQTYDNGDVVRWIGPAGSEEPAPTVTLTDAADESRASPDPSPAPASADDGGGSDGLAIAALIVGALGLLAGGTALVATRRTRARV
jgi:uncharacterized protein YcnI